jgi:hypothetical protein
VRAIATQFNSVAAQWKQAGPALRTGITTIEKGTSSTTKRRKSLVAAAAKVAARAQMWGERLVALQEQVRELEGAAGIQMDTAPSREWGSIDTNFDDDNINTTIEPNIVEEEDEPEVELNVVEVRDAGPAAAAPEDIENGEPANVFEESPSDEEAVFADIPGFEKEQRVFNERVAEDHRAESTDGLEVEPESDNVYREVASGEEAAPETPDTAAHDEGFLTGPRGTGSKKADKKADKNAPQPVADEAPKRRAPIKIEPVEIATAAEDNRIDIDADVAPETQVEVAADVDADAFDLYELGAVDFVEGVHA